MPAELQRLNLEFEVSYSLLLFQDGPIQRADSLRRYLGEGRDCLLSFGFQFYVSHVSFL